jgi:hypothetical protein
MELSDHRLTCERRLKQDVIFVGYQCSAITLEELWATTLFRKETGAIRNVYYNGKRLKGYALKSIRKEITRLNILD